MRSGARSQRSRVILTVAQNGRAERLKAFMNAMKSDSESDVLNYTTGVVRTFPLNGGLEMNKVSLIKSFPHLCPADECSVMQRQGYQSGVGGRGRGIRTVYKSGASVALVFSLFRAARSILITASCLLAVAASCILYPVSCPALQAEDEVMRIQKAYEGVRDIKGNFIQKSHIKDLKRTDTYRGEFFIKSSKMKWEYKGDKPQAIYINGDDIIVYQKKEKQALKARFDRATYGQAPIALLGGFGTISGEFNASMVRGKLVLTPKQPMGNVTRIEITLSERDFPIESLTVIDSHTNAIEIQLKDVKLNTGLKERMFEFVPPDGVTVLQQEQ